MKRSIAALVLVVSAILVTTSHAALITYEASYDPLTEVMTLENLSSDAQLQFTPLYGTYAGQSLAVPPGESVSMGKTGITAGIWEWILDLFRCTNEDDKETIILHGKLGGGRYRDLTLGSGWIPVPYCIEVTVPGDHKIVTENVTNYGCVLDPITSDSQLLWNSDDWTGPPSQATAELLTGSFHIQDDTESWVSVHTDVGYTGCMIPEPTSLIIWSVLGTIAITVGSWRRRRKGV